MADVSTKDRFEKLAEFYAESYLGQREFRRLVATPSNETSSGRVGTSGHGRLPSLITHIMSFWS